MLRDSECVVLTEDDGARAIVELQAGPCQGNEAAVAFFATVVKRDVLAMALKASSEKSAQKLAARLKVVDAQTVSLSGQGFYICMRLVSAAERKVLAERTRRPNLREMPAAAFISFHIDASYAGGELAAKAPMGEETASVPWELLTVLESLNLLEGAQVYDFIARDFYPKD